MMLGDNVEWKEPVECVLPEKPELVIYPIFELSEEEKQWFESIKRYTKDSGFECNPPL